MEEILDVQRPGCPREFFNIPVPKNHPFNPDNLDNLQMPLQRSRFNQRTGQTAGNPRQQVRNDPCMARTHNTIAPYTVTWYKKDETYKNIERKQHFYLRMCALINLICIMTYTSNKYIHIMILKKINHVAWI